MTANDSIVRPLCSLCTPLQATEETEEATEETVEDIALFADDGDVVASGECGINVT